MPSSENWKIVGVGDEEARYLIHVSGKLGGPDARGRVLDLDQGILFPENLLGAITARGYWYDYDGPQNILPGLISRVTRADTLPEVQKLTQARRSPT
jgi:hypothetical protein